MALSPRQRKIAEAGKAGCTECGACCARMRQLGYPDEALEEKHKANEAFWNAADDIVSEFDATQQAKKGKKNG